MQKKVINLAASFLLIAGFSGSAMAQYVWLNDKGVKQYSDLPPPKSVAKDKIIKTPFSAKKAIVSAENNEDAKSAAGKSELEKIEKPVTLASKNEDYNKRKIAREESEKKAAEDKQNSADKEKNCERAKSYKQSIDEGLLIMTRDKSGERVPLDAAQRAKELEDVKKSLNNCK
ncbi:MAG: DUF4124 domain-containing protein [Undibacterium sp.]|nr:DUF4124 domain-containing protein [Undibacterium sp.]